jgi:hypothetical protein
MTSLTTKVESLDYRSQRIRRYLLLAYVAYSLEEKTLKKKMGDGVAPSLREYRLGYISPIPNRYR